MKGKRFIAAVLAAIMFIAGTGVDTVPATEIPISSEYQQETSKLEVSVSSLEADADGTLSSSEVTVNTGDTGGYTVSSSEDWLRVSRYNYYNSYYYESSVSTSYDGTFYVRVDSNTSEETRTGTLTVTHKTNSALVKTIQVTQQGRRLTLTADVTSITAKADRTLDNDSVYVETDGTGGFRVASDSDWLTVGSSSSYGYSNCSFDSSSRFYVFVEKNDSSSGRTGTITVTHAQGDKTVTISVSQEGKQEAVLNVNPTSLTATSEEGYIEQTVTVDTQGTGGFEAVSKSSWITIQTSDSSYASSSVSSDGSSTLSIYVSKNAGSSSRTGTIQILHKNGSAKATVQVSQSAKDSVLKLSTTILKATSSGKLSPDYVKVSTDNTGGFTAYTSDTWIKLGSEKKSSVSMAGDGTVYVSVDKYVGTEKRQGTITFEHKKSGKTETVTVEQDYMAASLTVSPTEKQADRDGSFADNEVTVKTNGTGSYSVTVDSSTDWLKIADSSSSTFADGQKEMSFSSDGSFYLIANANSEEKRVAEITVTHESGTLTKVVKVSQAGREKSDPETELLSVNRERIEFQSPDKSIRRESVTIGTEDDVQWIASTDNTWITLSSDSLSSLGSHSSIEGKGSGKFYVNVGANGKRNERTGKITIRTSNGISTEEHIVIVWQDGKDVDLLELLKESTVRVPKKTISKNKKVKIQFDWKEGLYSSDIKSIRYSVPKSKKKVVSINKNGVITAKKKGKATISVKVTLEDGRSHTFKLKITVGKRKIKLTRV